jgi:AraC-like DNA-binding protein
MKTLATIQTIHEYNTLTGHQTIHPLVSILDLSLSKSGQNKIETSGVGAPVAVQALNFGFYSVFLKENKHCAIRYGRHTYDYQESTLLFIAPGQVVSIEEDGEDYQPDGHALLVHPDLLRGTALGSRMNEYSFFSYTVHEALHLSGQEKQIVLDCFAKIAYELKHALDKHSKRLIVANIELFLDYCVRFYDRQFITREEVNNDVLNRFEALLTAYFASEKPQTIGLPTVGLLAVELHLSANYFGDLIKKETGKTALEYIQAKLIQVAKEKLFIPGKSVSEVAYELGFKYPQHFTRFFKQRIGQSPHDYRMLN